MKSLILLHGALGSSAEFSHLIPLLEDEFEIYTFDLEGHGNRNCDSDFSIVNFSNNLIEFIEINELNKPDVFGYSMGGFVSLTTAMRRPEILGKIITLGSMLDWSPDRARAEVKMMNPDIIEEKVPKFAAYLSSLHLDWKENMGKTADMMIRLGDGEAPTLQDYSKITNKVFMGIGELDEMVSRDETKAVADVIVGSEFYTLEQTPHPLPKIDVERLNRLIRNKLL